MSESLIGSTIRIPALAYPNLLWLGDNVLLEPIARMSAVKDKSYILSNHPELFEGHPIVQGMTSLEQIPEDTKIININEAIASTEKDEGGERFLPGKNLRMWEAAGFPRVMDYPKLYLTAPEWNEVRKMRKWFNRPCVGVILRSKQRAKDWAYTIGFIRTLIKRKEFDVFVFAKGISGATAASIPPGAHFFLDRPLRDVMQGLAMMDVVFGPDTGLSHISAALGTETTVMCFSLFSDLYENYPTATVLESDNFTLRRGILGISLRSALRELDKHLLLPRKTIPVAFGKKEESEELWALFIRFRGVGDVLSSLPALATLKKMYPNMVIVYMTSPGVGELVRLSGVVDHVLTMDYEHGTAGLPLPPGGHDYTNYHTIYNTINAIDFGTETSEVPRALLFARAIGLDQVDYSTDWQFQIPESWTEVAHAILEQNGVPGNGRVIVMQSDSKGASRMWPMARQKEFVGIARKRGYSVVAVSDQEFKYPASVVNLTGKLSFQEYVGMIGAANILLCPDSGGLHIAGVTNNLALGLFGSVHPDLRIAHYPTVHHILGKAKCVACNDWQLHCCRGNDKKWPMCMWSIKADQVMRQIDQLLKASSSTKENTNAV